MATKNSNTAGTELGAHDVPGATDESSRLVHGFVPTRYELAVIAPHYLEAIHANGCGNQEETGRSTGERVIAFALERLATIGSILGGDELRRVLAPVRVEGGEGPPIDEILDLVTENAGEGNGPSLPHGDLATPSQPQESEDLGRTCAGLPEGPRIIVPTLGVNDESAHVVQAFVPTVQELAVLAQHYLDKANDIHLNCWLYAQVGSTDWRFTRFAEQRLQSIDDALGCDAFDAAVESIAAKWRTTITEIKANSIRCARCGCVHDSRYRGDCPMCESPIDPETAGDDPWDLDGIWLTFR